MKIKSKKINKKKLVRNPYDSDIKLTEVTLKKIDDKIIELKSELKKNSNYYSANVVTIKVLNFIKDEMLSKDEDGDNNFSKYWTYDLVTSLNGLFSSISDSGYMNRNY